MARLCRPLCGSRQTGNLVIEQSQILTTHNLAVLFAAFDLARVLRPHLRDMAGQCFRWICRRQQAKADQWHARLIMLKNTAYAWRQMVFYLSFLDRDEVRAFVVWSEDNLAAQNPDYAGRFQPALRGLTAAILPP